MRHWLRALKAVIHWLLAGITVLYLVTGLGIVYPVTIEAWTFGLLPRNRAFTIHDNLLAPFIVLLVAHILVTALEKRGETRKGQPGEMTPDDT